MTVQAAEKEAALLKREESAAAKAKELEKSAAAMTERENALAQREADLAEKTRAAAVQAAERESSFTKREAELAEKTQALEAQTASRDAELNARLDALREDEAILRTLPAFAPNDSTEAVLIVSYPIPAAVRKELLALHQSAAGKYRANRLTQAFEDYVKASELQPKVDYLSPYWAAATAERIKNKRGEALAWVNKSLEINPDYKPAQALKKKLEPKSAKPAPKKGKKK